jgi:FHA domain
MSSAVRSNTAEETLEASVEPAATNVAEPPMLTEPVFAGESDETVSIELDLKAFADHVPETHHAIRVARVSDPSVQDFADQALELAALRAEIKRLTRDYDVLQHRLDMREKRLQVLQQELSAMRARSREAKAAGSTAPDAPPIQEMSVTLDLTTQPPEATTPLPNVSALPRDVEPAAKAPMRRLVPMGHDGEPIELSREIMTIGRTRDNDICIPSRAVSRDHARLVVSARSVTVIDMHSANGCFVNDEPVKRHKLREADVLRIGDRSYRYSSN